MVYLQSSSAVSNDLRALHIFDAFYYFSLPLTFMNSLIYKLYKSPTKALYPLLKIVTILSWCALKC